MFDVAVQAAIGSHIIARETVKALRKKRAREGCLRRDVEPQENNCWIKQKAGEKRMKQVGTVEIPQRRFSPSCRLRAK